MDSGFLLDRPRAQLDTRESPCLEKVGIQTLRLIMDIMSTTFPIRSP